MFSSWSINNSKWKITGNLQMPAPRLFNCRILASFFSVFRLLTLTDIECMFCCTENECPNVAVHWMTPPTRDPRTKQPNKVRLGPNLLVRARPRSFRQLQQDPLLPSHPFLRQVSHMGHLRPPPTNQRLSPHTNAPTLAFLQRVMIVWKVHALGRSASCKIKQTGKKVLYLLCTVHVLYLYR